MCICPTWMHINGCTTGSLLPFASCFMHMAFITTSSSLCCHAHCCCSQHQTACNLTCAVSTKGCLGALLRSLMVLHSVDGVHACAMVVIDLQDTGPLFRHFKPRFPFSTDSSLTKASKLNCTFVFQKVAAPPTKLPRPLPRQPGNKPLIMLLLLCMPSCSTDHRVAMPGRSSWATLCSSAWAAMRCPAAPPSHDRRVLWDGPAVGVWTRHMLQLSMTHGKQSKELVQHSWHLEARHLIGDSNVVLLFPTAVHCCCCEETTFLA